MGGGGFAENHSRGRWRGVLIKDLRYNLVKVIWTKDPCCAGNDALPLVQTSRRSILFRNVITMLFRGT